MFGFFKRDEDVVEEVKEELLKNGYAAAAKVCSKRGGSEGDYDRAVAEVKTKMRCR